MTDQSKGLHEVADGAWAWIAHTSTWGWANAGLIVGDGRSMLVDTLYDLRLTKEMLDAMAPITTDAPITDALNTHGNGDHCFGNALLAPSVRINGAPGVIESMRSEDPAEMAALVGQDLGPVLGPFVRHCFGDFAFDEVTLREPDILLDGDTTLSLGGREVRLLPIASAHTGGDTVVHVPDAGVLFTGDILFAEATPVMWAGPVENWIDACHDLIALDPRVVVPGHGPLTTVDGIREMAAYLTHVRDQALDAHQAGKAWNQAADEIDLDRFVSLPDAERVVVTMHAIYRSIDGATPSASASQLFAHMAQWRNTRSANPA